MARLRIQRDRLKATSHDHLIHELMELNDKAIWGDYLLANPQKQFKRILKIPDNPDTLHKTSIQGRILLSTEQLSIDELGFLRQ